MAGLYLHIPFCQSRCIYCDFYSTTHLQLRDTYVEALCHELSERCHYLSGQPIDTIYLGGGTPTQLNASQLLQIFEAIHKHYTVSRQAEVTLEANPDDLSRSYMAQLGTLPINRISMGVQTFHDDTLRLLHRRHSAQTAIEAYRNCRDAGFANVSIDLMFGLPGQDLARWEADLRQAIALQPTHISAYALMFEEGTRLWQMREKGLVAEAADQDSATMYGMLIDLLADANYQHYEISNFCLPGWHSRHNSGYWNGTHYLGCGAAAHSYDGVSRQWNTADLAGYVGHRTFEREVLDKDAQYNDYIITRLRTSKGANLDELRKLFGTDMHDYCLRMANRHLQNGTLLRTPEGMLRLSRKGIFVSDGIMSDLLIVR